MKKSLHLAGYLLLLLVCITGCKKDSKNDVTDDVDAGKSLFVSATSSGSFTKLELQGLATLGGFGSFVPLVQYDVDFYKITYQTTYKGNKINASGLLCVPKGMPTTPALLSAQHGTMSGMLMRLQTFRIRLPVLSFLHLLALLPLYQIL